MRLPKGAIKPRPAVQQMAPYSPPTGGRAGKLRLDFNETVTDYLKVISVQELNAAALPRLSPAITTLARSVEVRAK